MHIASASRWDMLRGKSVSSTVLYDIARELATASRQGARWDTPEGTRYMQLSDTLVGEIVEKLRCIADALKEMQDAQNA